jgi:hypothetical protein
VTGIVARIFSRAHLRGIRPSPDTPGVGSFAYYDISDDEAGEAGRLSFLAVDERHTEMETVVLLEDLYQHPPSDEQVQELTKGREVPPGDLGAQCRARLRLLPERSSLWAPTVALLRMEIMAGVERNMRLAIEAEMQAIRARASQAGAALSWVEEFPPDPFTEGFEALLRWIDTRRLTEGAVLEALAARLNVSVKTLRRGLQAEKARQGRTAKRGRPRQ